MASAEQGVFSNVKQITALFGHSLLYSLLYISPWIQLTGSGVYEGSLSCRMYWVQWNTLKASPERKSRGLR